MRNWSLLLTVSEPFQISGGPGRVIVTVLIFFNYRHSLTPFFRMFRILDNQYITRSDAIDNSVATIKGNTALETEVDKIVAELNNLDATLTTSTTTVGGISTDVNNIHTELTTIKTR